MTHKVIALEFVVPTVAAIVLGIVLGMGAVYLTNHHLGPLDQEVQAASFLQEPPLRVKGE